MSNTVESTFGTLDGERGQLLERCRRYSLHTLNHVLPEYSNKGPDGKTLRPQEWDNGGSWTSLGSHAMANLVSKTLFAMFPSFPWFASKPTPAAEQAGPDAVRQFMEFLDARDARVRRYLAGNVWLPSMQSILEQVFVTGNGLLAVTLDDSKQLNCKAWRLDNWIPRRDSSGRVIQLWTRDSVTAHDLTDEEMELARIKDDRNDSSPTVWALYTEIEQLKDGGAKWRRELNGREIGAGSDRVSPWIPVGYSEAPGEHHSRGFVELHVDGTLRSLDALHKALIDGATMISRINPVVDERSGLRPRDLLVRNGQILSGRVSGNLVDGVGFIRTDKHIDMDWVRSLAQQMWQEVAQAMLLTSGSVRNSERTTALEVQQVTDELQGVLGGAYSRIDAELQRPFINLVFHYLLEKNIIPKLPDLEDGQSVTIQTGMAALQRSSDLSRLLSTVQVLAQMGQVIPGMGSRVKEGELTHRIMHLSGVDASGLIKSDEEVAEEVEAQQQAEIAQQASQEAVGVMGDVARQQLAQ